MSAPEKDMKRLHSLHAQAYMRMLEDDLKVGDERIPLSASDRAAINAFLKNNDVTMIRDEGSVMDDLDRKLKEMEEKRRAARVAPLTKQEIDDIDDRVIQ